MKLLNKIYSKIDHNELLTLKEIIFLLRLSAEDTKSLYQKADEVRKENMGDEIFLRGIIEFSNYCIKDCFYCGIGKSNTQVTRYRIIEEEIIQTCIQLEKQKQTTVVLQSGEDFFYTKKKLGKLISQIKQHTALAVTVSVGVRYKETYQFWQAQGMDRYLLRFESSNKNLFQKCHPDETLAKRLEALKNLQDLKVQTGSGFLIGLPDETLKMLAEDILFCTSLDLDMIGVGPFISHPDTAFRGKDNPFSKDIYFKTVSILRLLNKKTHIPSTTAFDAIDQNGRNLLLQRGANVFMPNATPQKYREMYQLYPGKPCVDESPKDCGSCTLGRIKALGRTIGKGPGHSIKR